MTVFVSLSMLLIVLVVSCFLVTPLIGTADHDLDYNTIYVIPDEESIPQCPTEHCHTFNKLVRTNFGRESFRSFTRVYLLPGNHLVSVNTSSFIENVSNLLISGISSIDNVTNSAEVTSRILCALPYGISFTKVTNLTISSLEFVGCGAPIDIHETFYQQRSVSRTISITNSHQVSVSNVIIANGSGVGLLLFNVYQNVTIYNSLFTQNEINFYVNYQKSIYNNRFDITVVESNFTHGTNDMFQIGLVSGIVLHVKVVLSHAQTSKVKFENVNLFNNSFYLDSNVNVELYSVNSTLEPYSNEKYGLTIGAMSEGIYNSIVVVDSFFKQSCVEVQAAHVQLVRINIDECPQSSLKTGGGEWIQQEIEIVNLTITNSMGYMIELGQYSTLTIRGNSLFYNNGGLFYGGDRNTMVVFSENSTTTFMNNNVHCATRGRFCHTGYCYVKLCSTLHFINTKIEVQSKCLVYFKDNRAAGSGGMMLEESTITFTGDSIFIFEGNTGNSAGAMEIQKSTITVVDTTIVPTIRFSKNRAQGKGGAINIHRDYAKCSIGNSILWEFANNTALVAGSTIYGNIESWIYDEDNDIESGNGCNELYESNHFQGSEGDTSVVASDPTRVCMCVDSVPNCNITNYTAELFPGQMFEMEAVAVGLVLQYGASPSVVQAEFDVEQFSWRKYGGSQYLQPVENHCTPLMYDTYLDNTQMNTLTLSINYSYFSDRSITWIEQNKKNVLLLQDIVISFIIKNCSLGFTLNIPYHRCDCQQTLIQHGIQCDEDNLTNIFRPLSKWVNATFSHTKHTDEPGVIVHDYCPFDYCVTDESIHLDLRYPDKQCTFNRSGVLCGECHTNFSQVFGSSRCKQCSSLWLLLLPSFALAGIALVVFLMLLNLTVAVGTINGLIFYANIVRANHAIFFPPQTTNSFLSWFIAWLNLDLGIETCFYDGLDAYAKTWLQFSFPFYIWFIVISIIVLCRYSTTLARLCGNNAVHVLATLFLLSYAKLNRTIITMFQPTTLEYPDGYVRRVWLYDGNVDYLKGKHIPLFIAGMLVLVLLSIPYTTILFTIQWLQRYTKYRFFPWVYNLKPVFDAYIGPYKDKHRYWTGLLLLVRVILFLIFSLNVFGDPSINLLAVILTSFCLLAYLLTIGSVYKTWPLHLVESSFIFNIGVLSSATLYIINSNSQNNRKVVTFISTTIAFITFVLICCYHVLQRVLPSKCGQQAKNFVMSLNLRCKSNDESPLNESYTPFQTEPTEFDSPQVTETVLDLRKSQLGTDTH